MIRKDTLEIAAAVDNLDELLDWMDVILLDCGFNGSAKVQLDIAAEEVYINIASYAYPKGPGNVLVTLEVLEDPLRTVCTFEDSGIPYDPLINEDPDVTLPVKERRIGGLGIYMTRQSMDEMTYEYRDGKNVLTLVKEYIKES